MEFPFPVPEGSPFPVANIPFGIFSTQLDPTPRPGVALGEFVLDLRELVQGGLHVDAEVAVALKAPTLNNFAALPRHIRSKVRKDVQSFVKDGTSCLYSAFATSFSSTVVPMADAVMHLPMVIPNFTDFMCSVEHVSTVGKLVGHDQVPPSFFHMPLGYNGRASSVIVSGQEVKRPTGMIRGSDGPIYAASQKLDYEVEMGMFISQPVGYGSAVPATLVHEHVFGFVLLNDWSARDIQFYEMSPLGPFLGKAGATSISPWIVTLDALEEAGALRTPNPEQETSHLVSPLLKSSESLFADVHSFVARAGSSDLEKLGESNVGHLQWSPFQMAAHLSSSGCGLDTGDLIGTGTLSSTEKQAIETGYDPDKRSGCLFEIVRGGSQPVGLSDGLSMTWVEDGDTIVMEGWAGRGKSRIGFGELRNTVMPQHKLPQ
ncbi:hypothetical protein IL306_009952 [Fusarium sp. DS 682]|nr:hypothetical protein IL306_009952 [Fusarium sp. DS 682]